MVTFSAESSWCIADVFVTREVCVQMTSSRQYSAAFTVDQLLLSVHIIWCVAADLSGFCWDYLSFSFRTERRLCVLMLAFLLINLAAPLSTEAGSVGSSPSPVPCSLTATTVWTPLCSNHTLFLSSFSWTAAAQFMQIEHTTPFIHPLQSVIVCILLS